MEYVLDMDIGECLWMLFTRVSGEMCLERIELYPHFFEDRDDIHRCASTQGHEEELLWS